MEENIKGWMNGNKSTFGLIILTVLFILGICFIIGSFKNWDWLYKADGHYQNNWSMGQISRYLGRGTARVLGFIFGIIVTLITGYFLYMYLTKKLL